MTTAIKPQELTKYEKLLPYFGDDVIEYINNQLKQGARYKQERGLPIEIPICMEAVVYHLCEESGSKNRRAQVAGLEWDTVLDCYIESGWIIKEVIPPDDWASSPHYFIFSTTVEPMGLPKIITPVCQTKASNKHTHRNLLDRLFKRN